MGEILYYAISNFVRLSEVVIIILNYLDNI